MRQLPKLLISSDRYQECTIANVTPLRVLFWNLGSAASPFVVSALAAEHEPDIIVLVESDHGIAVTVEEINIRTGLRYEIPFSLPSLFQFLIRLPGDRAEPVYDDSYMAIKHVRPVLGDTFVLAAVHLPSKLFLGADEQAALCSRWIRHIRNAETRVGGARTLVIGDLNMNPFEPGLVGAEGFHAVSSRAVVARNTRTVLGEERKLFYNPMWSMMGDAAGPPGTYYYHSSKPINYFWNTFDQVLLRPELARHFIPGDVAVVSCAGGESLLGATGTPNKGVSDHLPIIATLRLGDLTDDVNKFVG